MSRQPLAQLKAKGYKLTQQRQQILEVLLTAPSRLSAQEVHSLLKQQQVSISLDTVYRNLRLLVEIGAVQQISLQSGAVYELILQDELHYHVICVDCEKVVCIPACSALQNCLQQAGAAGFTILNHSLEIYGRCSYCDKKSSGC
ncbi:MAG TPA: Fur family transcriptional regulator [Oscillospiraceae bacterium]|nr:Fur family transcriptional regulator [Oscillospiraceae bacterium]